jgi:Domain of unknown function (DUF6438)
MRLFSFLSTALVLLLFLLTPVAAQQSSAPDYTHVTITMKAEGGPCGCVYANDNDLSCCPAYSVAVDENGTVVYNGIGGVKARGERVHSIPVGAVRDLVAGFFRVNFFSLQDRYTSKKLPNGNSETVDHSNATTISIDIDGKKKSIYIFYGAPQELMDLQRKLYEVTQIAQYVGRAEQIVGPESRWVGMFRNFYRVAIAPGTDCWIIAAPGDFDRHAHEERKS